MARVTYVAEYANELDAPGVSANMASGLDYGRGNQDQAFIERGVLTPGVYALKDGHGQWSKESEGIE